VAQGLTERLAGRPATSGIANSKFSGFFCPEFHPQRLANSRRTEASLAKSLISQMGSFQLERLSTLVVGFTGELQDFFYSAAAQRGTSDTSARTPPSPAAESAAA